MPLSTHHHRHNLSTASIDHPHPLRSHSSAEDILAASSQDSTSTHPSTTLQLPRPISNASSRGSLRSSRRGSTHVLTSIPSLPTQGSITAKERLGHSAWVGKSGGEVSLIASPIARPQLRPMVSFSSLSKVSYYSINSPILEKQSKGIGRDDDRNDRDAWRFYGCFACLSLLNFVCDVSITALSTALPTLSEDLSLTAVQTLWVPGSLLLSAAIAQPLFMRLSAALGCKSLLLFGIAVFVTGSALAACSHNATTVILARSIEGFGIGAITVLTQLTLNQIDYSQGHPAHHRRILRRSASHLFWLGIAVGPIVGGACAETVGWRYLFWIQVVASTLVLVALPFLLRLPYVEAGSIWKRLLKLDVLGWLLLSGSLVSVSLAVSLGGTRYAWNSFDILLPLLLGVAGLLFWCAYSRYRIDAILPISIFHNASAAAACFGAFAQGAILTAVLYLMPIFLQLQGLNELVAGVSLAPWTFSIVAFGLLGGAVQSLSGYRWAIWTGWAFAALGTGLMMLFDETTSAAISAPIGLIGGIGLGMLLPSQTTAIESAASTDDETIHAAPLNIYLATLGRCFGVLGGSSIFLNSLEIDMLNNWYLSGNAPNYSKHTWSLVKVIADLPTEQAGLRASLISAYTSALRPVWITACAVGGLAFLLSFWFLEDHAPSRKPSLPDLPELE